MGTVPASPTVLRLITRLNIGGPAIQAILLTAELHDLYPTVLAAGRAPTSEGELSSEEVLVRQIPLVRPIRPPTDLSAYKAIARLIRDLRPRLVHTHMAKAGALGRLAARRTFPYPKAVHTFHGHVLEGYFSRPVERALVAIERHLAARTHALVAVSDEIRDSLLDLGIGRPHQWHVIPLGFDLSPFLAVSGRAGGLREELRLADAVPLVAVIGRLTAVKDHATLLDAVARVPGVHVALAGDGELQAALRQRAARSDLAGRVHFLGWRTDIAELMSDVDLVALSSVNEGTPVSLIEGSAAARPIVATDVGGVRAVVAHGRTGLVVPRRDPLALSHALSEVLQDPVRAKAMGLAGRAAVRERFSKRRLLRDMAALYDGLLVQSRDEVESP